MSKRPRVEIVHEYAVTANLWRRTYVPDRRFKAGRRLVEETVTMQVLQEGTGYQIAAHEVLMEPTGVHLRTALVTIECGDIQTYDQVVKP